MVHGWQQQEHAMSSVTPQHLPRTPRVNATRQKKNSYT